jgi:hypothetical protein
MNGRYSNGMYANPVPSGAPHVLHALPEGPRRGQGAAARRGTAGRALSNKDMAVALLLALLLALRSGLSDRAVSDLFRFAACDATATDSITLRTWMQGEANASGLRGDAGANLIAFFLDDSQFCVGMCHGRVLCDRRRPTDLQNAVLFALAAHAPPMWIRLVLRTGWQTPQRTAAHRSVAKGSAAFRECGIAVQRALTGRRLRRLAMRASPRPTRPCRAAACVWPVRGRAPSRQPRSCHFRT